MGRRLILQLCLGVLLSCSGWPGQALAQTRQERRLASDLAAGAAAYEDGLYATAQRFFERARGRAQSEEEVRESTLWLLRALYRQGDYAALLDLLDPEFLEAAGDRLRPIYRFWRARTAYAMGAYPEVIAELDQLDAGALGPAEAAQRLRMYGRAYARTGQYESALVVFELFDRHYTGDEDEVVGNWLDWAAALLDLGRGAEAEAPLQRIVETYPESVEARTARLWLGVYWAEQGRDLDARLVLDELIERARPRSDWTAEAWYALARIEEEDDALDAALDALAQGQAAARSPDVLNRGRLYAARLHFRRGEWAAGIALLRTAIAARPGAELAAQAQIELAEALLNSERYEESLRAFQDYLEAFDDDIGRANAYLGRAWSLLGLRRPREAAASFERAYEVHPGLRERQQALFKLADSYFEGRQYARAREEYLQMTQVFPGSEWVPLALFQAAECLARQGARAAAEQEFRAIEDAYSDSYYAERAILRIGAMQEEQQAWEAAMATYTRLMDTYPRSAFMPEALHRRGMIRYRLGRYSDALLDFEQVTDFPVRPDTEQAFYLRGWCLYLLGENEQALAVCETFIAEYPESRWVPDVLFWLASYHFNHGAFAEAERRFAALAAAYPDGALTDRALYWAGRAAMAREDYLDAMDYFNQLAGAFPNSSKQAEMRFAQGDALTQLGEFPSAILAFDEVIRRFPDSGLVDRARGRKGDCQFTLGSEDPGRYEEALASFEAVLESATASESLKQQAEFKRGRCLEQLEQREAALEAYLNVVYDHGQRRQAEGDGNGVWYTRAVFRAAAMKEAEGRSAEALSLLQRVVDSGMAAAPDAERQMEQIRRRLTELE